MAGSDAAKIESLTRNLLECYEELDLIYRISRGLMSNLVVQENVQLILDEAIESLEADLGWVVPLPAVNDAPTVFTAAYAGVVPETAGLIESRMVHRLMEEGASKLFYRFRREIDTDDDGVPDGFLCSVLRTDKTLFGALCLGRKPGRSEFTAGDLKLANLLASQAAVALENAVLQEQRLAEQQVRIRLQEEVRLARTIQQNLLPKSVPELEGYEIVGSTRPAQSVGGDYYDFIPLDTGRVALCLGDVSGKGMPAALLMAHLQAAIRGQTLMRASPRDALGRSNTLLYESTDNDRFATCFYGVLDAREHRLQYANAGHDHPILCNGSSTPRQLDTGGLVLGVLPDMDYDEASVSLGPGDLLVIYSDGITDAADAADREFGLDRLHHALREGRDRPAPELLEGIYRAVDAHAGGAPQTDDMTLIVIRRH